MRYWVVGGEYRDTSFPRSPPARAKSGYGPYASYGEAYDAWSARARATIDDATVRYRILTEDEGRPRSKARANRARCLARVSAGRHTIGLAAGAVLELERRRHGVARQLGKPGSRQIGAPGIAQQHERAGRGAAPEPGGEALGQRPLVAHVAGEHDVPARRAVDHVARRRPRSRHRSPPR